MIYKNNLWSIMIKHNSIWIYINLLLISFFMPFCNDSFPLTCVRYSNTAIKKSWTLVPGRWEKIFIFSINNVAFWSCRFSSSGYFSSPHPDPWETKFAWVSVYYWVRLSQYVCFIGMRRTFFLRLIILERSGLFQSCQNFSH